MADVRGGRRRPPFSRLVSLTSFASKRDTGIIESRTSPSLCGRSLASPNGREARVLPSLSLSHSLLSRSRARRSCVASPAPPFRIDTSQASPPAVYPPTDPSRIELVRPRRSRPEVRRSILDLPVSAFVRPLVYRAVRGGHETGPCHRLLRLSSPL